VTRAIKETFGGEEGNNYATKRRSEAKRSVMATSGMKVINHERTLGSCGRIMGKRISKGACRGARQRDKFSGGKGGYRNRT
jgi:hypothetical protein